jgi:cobalt-precorrin 5A hydrolase
MRVAGFGLRDRATVGALQAALAAAGGAAGLAAIATAEDKAGHPALAALAGRLGLPLRAVPLAAIAAAPAAPARHAPARYGGRSLAEAAALAAAGPGARLLASRAASPDGTATCAIAEAPP